MSRPKVFLVLFIGVLVAIAVYTYQPVLNSAVASAPASEAMVPTGSLSPIASTALIDHEIEKHSTRKAVLKTLDEQLKDNHEAVMKKERELKESHAIERLNSRRLSAQESRGFYEMIDAVARLRAQRIELRLLRLQARIERGQ